MNKIEVKICKIKSEIDADFVLGERKDVPVIIEAYISRGDYAKLFGSVDYNKVECSMILDKDER